MVYLALVLWPLGEAERARQFANQAASQAKSGNVQTLAYVMCCIDRLSRHPLYGQKYQAEVDSHGKVMSVTGR